MTSAKFKYIDRKKSGLLVLIPGWASDHRIFTPLNLEFNYLIPLRFSPFSFEKDLLAVIKESNTKRLSLFGWSLGGFVAAGFASKHSDLIDEIILVSIRKRYKAEELVGIKRHLKKSKKGYLYKFYSQCFFKKEQMHWFRENLLRNYCKELDLNYLLKTLDYLENAEIKPKSLKGIKRIKIIHGEDDVIAPILEAMEIKESLTHARFIRIKGTGHIPFLKEDFGRYI